MCDTNVFHFKVINKDIFNVADEDGFVSILQAHKPETHLINTFATQFLATIAAILSETTIELLAANNRTISTSVAYSPLHLACTLC